MDTILIIIKEIGAIIAIVLAIYGIDSWRREHAGKRQIELAEETLALFYQARDAISHIRDPTSFVNETADLKRGDDESEKAFEARKLASVAFSRYTKYQEIFHRLHSLRYEFMVRIGRDEAKPFDELRVIINEILISARVLSRLWARDRFRTEQDWEKHLKDVEKRESVFWEGWGEVDPINPKADKVIEEIERVCKEVIAGKGTLHYFLNRPFWGKR
ncbi:MAG: hypothetical protein HY913_10470 [Desulfomonile tiedjei]|nr:hypothetical protein [Desulfomonile tiedjei]